MAWLKCLEREVQLLYNYSPSNSCTLSNRGKSTSSEIANVDKHISRAPRATEYFTTP